MLRLKAIPSVSTGCSRSLCPCPEELRMTFSINAQGALEDMDLEDYHGA
jgi:hypothetical protein